MEDDANFRQDAHLFRLKRRTMKQMIHKAGHVPFAVEDGGGVTLKFWGVRGSLPTPGPATVRYGGNTLCIELRCGPHLLILDVGSGLRELGGALAAKGLPIEADILLSHTHLDHICGLPFFPAMFDPTARLRFWGGHLAPPGGIAEALMFSWNAPLMPQMDAEFRALYIP